MSQNLKWNRIKNEEKRSKSLVGEDKLYKSAIYVFRNEKMQRKLKAEEVKNRIKFLKEKMLNVKDKILKRI
jgi:hypothetical protein